MTDTLPRFVIVARTRSSIEVWRSSSGITTAARDVPEYLSELVATCPSIDAAAKVANSLNAEAAGVSGD